MVRRCRCAHEGVLCRLGRVHREVAHAWPRGSHHARGLHARVVAEQLQTCLAKAEQLADTERTKLHVRADRLIYDHLAAYMAMSAADMAGDFADAAQQADKMLAIRKQLHAIDLFFIQPD